MTEIDIWADDEPTEASFITKEASVVTPTVTGKQIAVEIKEKEMNLYSEQDLLLGDFLNLTGLKTVAQNGKVTHYSAYNSDNNAYVLRYALKGYKAIISPEDGKKLAENANKVTPPTATLTEDNRHVQIDMPGIKVYRDLVHKVNGYPTKTGYRIDISKVLDLEAMGVNTGTKLPQITFSKEVIQLNSEPIYGYGGTLSSLKTLPIDMLNVVNANNQSWKATKNSTKTLKDKMNEMGIETLHDLLFWLPRRYIDKSKPQDISDLIEGETAVIVGKIDTASELNSGRGGAIFEIRTNTGSKIRVTFFNQRWLLSKFRVGSEVLVTGKFSWWNREPQIGGASIEHAEEAAILPIVPIYNQSPSKGITTYFIMSANRELISRLGTINLPPYLEQEGKMTYFEALTSLHFPESLDNHYEALDTLAYYELIYMQVLIQEAKENSVDRDGLNVVESSKRLQAKAIKSLPYTLTVSQKRAIVEMNKKMADNLPSSTLLTADVGAGKSIVAQLAAIRAVDGGFQAAILGPTDILARQLYETLQRVITGLTEGYGDKVEAVFLSGSMKVREKKAILAKIEDGTANIIVGTHSLMADSVKYKNLGFIAIDEQQKFGAEQRTKLLNSREDGKVPDILMQTATPIPRSMSQIFYGDIDTIEMKEKPAGRIPIITEWIQEDPTGLTAEIANDIWNDVISEADQGHQTFIITPLVSESTSIDSASVERTFKNLSTMALSGLRVAFVHGKMKQDAQRKVMEDFRAKEYDVLVASTVIEVGVDIPDATRVIILSADRLGSSSLHQIRGRVGRNAKPSKCYLVSLGKTENSQLRLQSLVDNEDGFEIAKNDLKIRGEGKMFNTEQSGRSEMIFASLAKHSDKIDKAKSEALRILSSKYRGIAIRECKEIFESNERMM